MFVQDPSTTTTDPLSDPDPLLATAANQSLHNQENTYRACASITTFNIKDPDPYAVDSGHVLVIRIDVCSTGKYIRPYYIMINKPFPGSKLLRVHKHTVPPCIPIDALAQRYLPTGKGVSESIQRTSGKRQDVIQFARAIRKEAISYQNRMAVIKSMRKSFALDERKSRKETGTGLSDVSAADAEAKQVRVEWADGRIGRFVVSDKGDVEKCVIIGEEGRDRENERRVLGGNSRMEGVADRLKEGIY